MSQYITVGMAIFNPKISFLEEQLKSIINQTKKPNKIVLIDDFSNDFKSVKNKIDEVMSKSNIKYEIYPNEVKRGVNYSFKKSYQYFDDGICFLSDQDDVWYETKIEEVTNFFKSKKKLLLTINDCNFYADGKINKEMTKCSVIKQISGTDRNFVAGCCTAVDSRILKYVNAGLFNFLNYDDQLHAIANLLNSRVVLRKSLQLYRRHDKNVSQSAGNFLPKKIYFVRPKLKFIIHKIKEATYYYFIKLNLFQLEQMIKSFDNKEIKNERKIIETREIVKLIYDSKLKNNIFLILSRLLSRKMLTIFLIFIGILTSMLVNKVTKS